jgi:hypothetical protein
MAVFVNTQHHTTPQDNPRNMPTARLHATCCSSLCSAAIEVHVWCGAAVVERCSLEVNNLAKPPGVVKYPCLDCCSSAGVGQSIKPSQLEYSTDLNQYPHAVKCQPRLTYQLDCTTQFRNSPYVTQSARKGKSFVKRHVCLLTVSCDSK